MTKRFLSLFLAAALLLSAPSALAAKAKPTATPAPQEISPDPLDPPEQIRNLLDIAYSEWETVDGKDQGKKNKYTTWYNNYDWGKNRWCAGFVTWCMLEAEIPQLPEKELKSEYEEGGDPGPVFHVKGSSPGKTFPGYLYLHRSSAIPQKGFVILYGAGGNRYIHEAIVYDVRQLPDGRYRLTTIEGAMKNTVRMYVFDYDANAERKKNITLVPEEERTREESKIFTYGQHDKKERYYVNCFLMSWVPDAAGE